jgi:hypothetical protein
MDTPLIKCVWQFIGSEQIKAIGAVLVATAALWRFFRSENQKQARNASSLIERFSKNDMNLAAMRMIDWEDGKFHVRTGGTWKDGKYDPDTYTKALRTTDTYDFLKRTSRQFVTLWITSLATLRGLISSSTERSSGQLISMRSFTIGEAKSGSKS